MHIESFHEWVHQIYTTQDKELDCDEFFDAIPKYVDMEVAGEKTNPRFPEIELHLTQCPQCYDFYLTLHDAARLESQVAALEATMPQPDRPSHVVDDVPSIGGVPLVL